MLYNILVNDITWESVPQISNFKNEKVFSHISFTKWNEKFMWVTS